MAAQFGFAAELEKRPTAIADEARWVELQGGEPVLLTEASKTAKGAKKRILAGIIIDAPVKAVWDVICDKEAAPGYIEDLKRSKILEKGVENGIGFHRVEQDMKMGLLGTFNYTVKHRHQPYDRIDFKRESGDLKDIEGYWEFVPLKGGDKTLLIYQLHIDPGLLIPGPVIRNSLKKSLPDALIGIRNRVMELRAKAGN